MRIVRCNGAQAGGVCLQNCSVGAMLAQHVKTNEKAIGVVEIIHAGIGGNELYSRAGVDGTARRFWNDEISVRCECAREAGNGETPPSVRGPAGELVRVEIPAVGRKLKM